MGKIEDNDNLHAAKFNSAKDPIIEDKETISKTKTLNVLNNGNIATENKKTEIKKSLAIQVAAFKNPVAADQMIDKLKEKGYPAYKAIKNVHGENIWYKVRIGSFRNRTDANETLVKLKKEGIKTIIVHINEYNS